MFDLEPSKTDRDLFTVGSYDTEEGTCSINLWEDEETQQFYTEFPNLKDYLPNFKVVKPEKTPDSVVSSTNTNFVLC